jgi:hypothetical protein
VSIFQQLKPCFNFDLKLVEIYRKIRKLPVTATGRPDMRESGLAERAQAVTKCPQAA